MELMEGHQSRPSSDQSPNMKFGWVSKDLILGLNEVPDADLLVASEMDEDAE